MTNHGGKMLTIALAAAMLLSAAGCGSGTSQDISSQAVVSVESTDVQTEGSDVIAALKTLENTSHTAEAKYVRRYRALCTTDLGIDAEKIDDNNYLTDSDIYSFAFTREISVVDGARTLTCSGIRVTEYIDCMAFMKSRYSAEEYGKSPDNPTTYCDFMENPETEVAEAFTKLFENVAISYGNRKYSATYQGEVIADNEKLFSHVLDAVAEHAKTVYSDDTYMLNFINCSENSRAMLANGILDEVFYSAAGNNFGDLSKLTKAVESGDTEIKALSETEADYVEQKGKSEQEVIIKKSNAQQYDMTVLLTDQHTTRADETVSLELVYAN